MEKNLSNVDINHKFTKPHLKVSILKSYLVYVKRFYPNINISRLCEDSGLPLEYLSKDDNWISLAFEKRFMDILQTQIDDKDLVKKVGKFGVDRELLGSTVYFLVTNFLGVDQVYKKIAEVASLFNKTIKITVVNYATGKIELSVQPVVEGLDASEIELLKERMEIFIESLSGYLSAIPTMKLLPEADVKILNSDLKKNTYIISINYKSEEMRNKTKLLLVPLSISIALTAVIKTFSQINNYQIILLIILIFGTSYILHTLSKLKKTQQVASQTEATLNKLDEKYKELHTSQNNLIRKLNESNLTNDIVGMISKTKSEDELLATTCKAFIQNLDYDRAIILTATSDKENLTYSASFGESEDFNKALRQFKLSIDIDSTDPNKISNVYRFNKPLLIKDVPKHLETLFDEQSKRLLLFSKSNSFLCVPIATENNKYGVAIVDCVKKDKSMTDEDLTLLTTIGTQLAIALEKIRAQQEVVDAYMETVALAESYSRFVPWESLKFLNYKTVHEVKIGDGAEQEMTILFSDIRDFTSLCETMTPPETLKFLNSYFGRLSPSIKKHNGTIDKFIGDCIMAIFSNSTDALNAAIEIQRNLVRYNLLRVDGGRKAITAGVGIATGNVIAGPLGFDGRLEITVLSDTVNVASRLDGLCKEYSAKILLTQSSIDKCQIPDFCILKSISGVTVKGKEKTFDICEVVDMDILKDIGHLTDENQKSYVKKLKLDLQEKYPVKKIS